MEEIVMKQDIQRPAWTNRSLNPHKGHTVVRLVEQYTVTGEKHDVEVGADSTHTHEETDRGKET